MVDKKAKLILKAMHLHCLILRLILAMFFKASLILLKLVKYFLEKQKFDAIIKTWAGYLIL